jgi:hypothetical protein
MSMLPISDSFMPSATESQARPEANFVPTDPHQIDELGDPGPFTMELADVYSAILVVVPLGILAKSLIL